MRRPHSNRSRQHLSVLQLEEPAGFPAGLPYTPFVASLWHAIRFISSAIDFSGLIRFVLVQDGTRARSGPVLTRVQRNVSRVSCAKYPCSSFISYNIISIYNCLTRLDHLSNRPCMHTHTHASSGWDHECTTKVRYVWSQLAGLS